MGVRGAESGRMIVGIPLSISPAANVGFLGSGATEVACESLRVELRGEPEDGTRSLDSLSILAPSRGLWFDPEDLFDRFGFEPSAFDESESSLLAVFRGLERLSARRCDPCDPALSLVVAR